MIVTQNIARLNHLLQLYQLSEAELLEIISEDRKTLVPREEVFSEEIKLSHLKKIDKLFGKGLSYYVNPAPPDTSKESSIFFRKTHFHIDLNFGARKVVNRFEELKLSISGMAALADVSMERKLPVYKLSHNPQSVAAELRPLLYPPFKQGRKEFLEGFIKKLAAINVLVFEFVETWNQKYKANIDGFFLSPNVIVLKRQQKAFRREIFTLAHELGHYLLNVEEIESLDYQQLLRSDLNQVEKWCNDFAYYFLAGEYNRVLAQITEVSPHNDYEEEKLSEVSARTHLSRMALFTRLRYLNKMSYPHYMAIVKAEKEKQRQREAEDERQKQLNKEMGLEGGGRTPVPIKSPLLIATIQTAFYEGVINEYEACKSLHITPDKLGKFLAWQPL